MAVLSVQEASAEGVTPRGVEPEGPGYGSQAREPDPRRSMDNEKGYSHINNRSCGIRLSRRKNQFAAKI